MPRQLSQMDRSPFLGIGTRSASFQALGTDPSFHTLHISDKKHSRKAAPPHFTISGNIPDAPAAL